MPEVTFDRPVSDALLAARTRATLHKSDAPLTTMDIVSAIVARDTGDSWARITLQCPILLDQPASQPDPHPWIQPDSRRSESYTWDEAEISEETYQALDLANFLADAYDFEVIDSGLIAIAIVGYPRSVAARAILRSSRLPRRELLQLLQLELTDGEWEDFDEALAIYWNEHKPARTVDDPPLAPGATKPKRVFISYSRNNYYTAEIVHATLAEAEHLRPWLDVRELSLGQSWSEAINEAIDSSDVFVLVASREAVGSQYVQQEVQRATEQGIPIVVAVASAVDLPASLQSSNIYDLRSDIDLGIRELQRGIHFAASGKPDTSSRQPPVFYRPPAAFLLFTLCLLVELAAVGLCLASSIISVVSPIEPQLHIDSDIIGKFVIAFSGTAAAGPIVLCIIATLTSLLTIVAAFRRRLKPLTFTGQRFAIFTVLAITLVLGLSMRSRERLSQIPLPAVVQIMLAGQPTVLVLIVVVMIVGVSILILNRSMSCYIRAGYAIDLVRDFRFARNIAINEDLGILVLNRKRWNEAMENVVAKLPTRRRRSTFQLVHEPDDRGIAEYLRKGCAAVGLKESDHAYWMIRLVSNLSDLDSLDTFAAMQGGRAVFALVSPIEIPDDSLALRRLQWLDFRRHDLFSLRYLLCGLTTTQAHEEPVPVPVDPSRFRASQSISAALYNPVIGAGISLSVAAGLFLSSTTTTPIVVAEILAVVAMLLCTRMAVRVARRAYTWPQFRLELIFGYALLAAGVTVGSLHFAPSLFLQGIYVGFACIFAWSVQKIVRPLRNGWLLTSPTGRRKAGRAAISDFGPMLAIFCGFLFTVILSAGIAPKPDLYWSTGIELGGLYPNTALPSGLRLDNHNFLSDLTWSPASTSRVEATGLLNVNDCTPNCAEGNYTATQVSVTAFDPATCLVDVYTDRGFSTTIRIFTKISILTPDGQPTEYDVGQVSSAQSTTTLQCTND
jgi:hypothetical protein